MWGPPITDSDRDLKVLKAVENCNFSIGIGFTFQTSYATAKTTFPSKTVAVLDGCATGITCVVFNEEEGSFLAGAVAALKSSSKIVGFVSGVSNLPVIERFEAGFREGVKHIDPNITVMVEYLSDFPDLSGFGNPGLAENISLAMYDQGVDVIMHASGSSGFGVFKAAYEKTTSDNSTHRWAIGVDADQYMSVPALYRPHVLTSMMKNVDVATKRIIDDYMNGTMSSFYRLGASEDWVGVSKTGGFFTSHYDTIDTLIAEISNGTIVVSGNLSAVV